MKKDYSVLLINWFSYTLVAASAIASCVSGLPHATYKSSDEEEKENFLARVLWLPVTSRSYVTHSLTDGHL